MKSINPASAEMLQRRTSRYLLLLLGALCNPIVAFPTQTPFPNEEVQQLQVNIPHSGPVLASLGSSISIPCLVSLSSSVPTSASSTPVAPRVKWTVVSGGVETQILVIRGQRVKINEAYRDRAALLNYTSSPDDASLWLGDLRHSDSGHYRCEVQQGLEDGSDLIQLEVKGVVFHYRDAFGRYAFSFHQARRACEAIGAQIATPEQLLAAYKDGYEQCDAGWLADQSVRYPIQLPREACYGDMDGQPGVRNYGTMEAENLFDVYCYIEQIDGEVFHDSVPQYFSFKEAQLYCDALGAKLATTAQLYSAWSEGLDHCSPGWLSDGSVRYPIINPRERCGGPQAGVKTVYRFSNQTGFPEPSSLHDAYCFRAGTRQTYTPPEILVTTEAEDIEQNVVILKETDLELLLNQQAEHVEREAQSILESLSFFSAASTPITSTNPTDILETTDSPSITDHHHPFVKTPEMTPSLNLTNFNSDNTSRDIYKPSHNISLSTSDSNKTDSNETFTFQSEFEITSIEPQNENHTETDTNHQETTQTSEELKQPQDIHEISLNVSRTQANYSEIGSNHTEVGDFWEADTLSTDPTIQVKLEELTMELPHPNALATKTSKEEETAPTQVAQMVESATEALTPLWVIMDGSGDTSKEKDNEDEAVGDLFSSSSATSSVITHSSFPATASSATDTNQTESPDPILLSHHPAMIGLENSTAAEFWESDISRQEGSTSLETEDSLDTENEDNQLQATHTVDQIISEAILNNSFPATELTPAQPKTPGYRVYLDTVTTSYEEASGYEFETSNTTFRDDIQVPTNSKNETTIFPALEKEANVLIPEEKKVSIDSTLIPEKVASTHEEATKVAPTLVEDVKIGSTLVLEEAKTVPTVLVETETKVAPTHVFEELKFDQILDADTNASTSPTLEGEREMITFLDDIEEANSTTSFEDFTASPSESETSQWNLFTTTRPQLTLKDVEFGQKVSSTSASWTTAKPTAPKGKISTTTIRTTTYPHWSARTWSPITTSPKVLHKTAEPQKVTRVIPAVDHGMGDVEMILTQPPTLLILSNERAAVGGAGKSSDACMDNTCLNGGTCTELNNQIKCLCLPTYEGDFCQTDLENCEPGWDKFQGFCYRHSAQRQSWEVAEQHCRMMGAHLVSIMNQEEQDYINSNYKEYQWTGLNDRMIEDDFHWSDGNPLLYENWYRGQPDSYFLSGEDCVVMVWHDDGRWSDVPCNYHLAYTCKKGTSSCGPPPKVRNASIFGKIRPRYAINNIVRYHCGKGFQQKLNPLVRCLSGGRWERPQILCVPEGEVSVRNPDVMSEVDFAAAENEFEATEKTPLYQDIKFGK